MKFSDLHKNLSFKNLLTLIITLAVLVQVSVITYNHFSGFYVLKDWQHAFLRLARGISLSTFAGFLIAYPDLISIGLINKKLSWKHHPMQRVLLQLTIAMGIAIPVSLFITLFANLIKPYQEPLNQVLFYNALIYSVVNVMVMIILEGWIYYLEGIKSQQMAESLREELGQIRFEVLKSQINPHFMFNSLNVLSGLISTNTSKAQEFIDEFSAIYRYVLESIEIPVTSLGKELDFAQSYLFLQKIRYGNALVEHVDVPAGYLNYLMPPLTLQVILENAIKHNIVNENKPLEIKIFTENEQLIIKNKLQPKVSSGTSTGLGLKNLVKRYALISNEVPEFTVQNYFYISRLPMIKPETDENINR